MAKKLIPPNDKDRKSPVTKIARHLKKHIIGQDRPIREISRALERAFSGLKDPNRPIATLAFFGPTAVGKTELCKVLANAFGKKKVWRCRKFDECNFQITKEELKQGVYSKVPDICPEHANARARIPLEEVELPNIWIIDCGGLGGTLDHAITTLLGSPPSYVGNKITPRFTGGKAPRVVVFDEAEKALLSKNWGEEQSTFANVLLKILDEGRIMNNHNEEVDFRQSIIILTGNLGASEILKEFGGQTLGFITGGQRSRNISEMSDSEVQIINQRIYRVVKEKADKELAPEFLNRLDRLVVFHFLTRADYNQILELELAKVQALIEVRAEKKEVPIFFVTYTPEAMEILLDESMSDRAFGARTLKRVIEKRISTPLSELLNEKLFKDGDHIEVRMEPTEGEGKSKPPLAFYRLEPDESPLLLANPDEERKGE